MFIAETQIRVRYAETDQMNVVYHGNYAQYFEVARAESIRQLGFTYKDMEKMGIIMPVVELHTKFIRPAHYDALLTVKTILKELPANHRIEFQQEVYDEKNELLTVGKVVLYFMDAKTMKKTSMPEQLVKKIRPFFKESSENPEVSSK
ncbi:MAG: acyl-CoA thioesterase [Bacteroidetes bacterium]|nr:acyl-CoA thioesterase [Bacteroidota bacterium]MBS1934337.1 acyl-CoA thioesterase [Bacteroidota bacterium]